VTFGDHDPADTFDPTARPDPEQVARRLHDLNRARSSGPRWDEMTPAARLLAVAVVVDLLAWLRRSGHLRDG